MSIHTITNIPSTEKARLDKKIRILAPHQRNIEFSETAPGEAEPIENQERTFESPLEIRAELLSAAGQVRPFTQCSVLDYPGDFDVGGHLIWLGLMSWLRQVRRARVNYAASIDSFSARALERQSARHPILLSGGGSLGDLSPTRQSFREDIIARYHDRPIVIMPQSIWFKNPCYLKRASRVFNAHPDLTLFARDRESFAIANEHFSRCHVLLAPDMSFQLADWLTALPLPEPRFPSLLLRSKDAEIRFQDVPRPELSQAVEADWATEPWLTRWHHQMTRKFPALWATPSTETILSAALPLWQNAVALMAASLSELPDPPMHLRSLELTLRAIRQLSPFRLIATNRLHGHALSVLLGIPNILLPDLCDKNQAFYLSWTRGISSCRFAPGAEMPEIPHHL